MSVSWTPTCSFGGVAFSTEQREGPGWEEEIDFALNASATDVPGGDNTYVQIGGRQSVRWQRDLILPLANYAPLRAKLNARLPATLTVHGTAYTAVMLSLSAIRRRDDLGLVRCSGSWQV